MKPQQDKPKACPAPNGCLVIIGGAENKKPDSQKDQKPSDPASSVLATFVNCCKKKAPCIEVISTAGEEGVEETFREYEASFKELGAQEVGHIYHRSRQEVNSEELKERIRKADGVFMAGGDQLRLTSIYGGTDFLTCLKEAYLFDRLTIGGTSAGAMALSTPMIFGGTGEQEMIAGGVKVTTGMEFLKDVCIDTHFVHRGRFVRMAQVIATNPACIGIGIEEDTAIVITEGLRGKVVGNGVVIIIDGIRSQSYNVMDTEAEKKVTIRDLEVSILAADELFEIPQRNPPHQ